jgi:hypothetical protein
MVSAVDGSRSAGQSQLYSSFGGDSVLAVDSLRRALLLGRPLSGKSDMMAVFVGVLFYVETSLRLLR